MALRGFGGIRRIDEGVWSLSRDIGLDLKLQSLRALFVSWAEATFAGVRGGARREAFSALTPLLTRLDAQMPDFYNQNIMSNDYHCASMQCFTEAGRRSAGLVEAIESLEYRLQAFDIAWDHNDILDTAYLSGPNGRDEAEAWRVAQRDALRADIHLLTSGTTCTSLMMLPLWPSSRSSAIETNVAAGGWKDFGGRCIERWIMERKDGALVMGKEPRDAAAGIVGIASQESNFWTGRPAKDVIAALQQQLFNIDCATTP